MRVLIACEYSGRVREAFKAKGHDAWSCDLLPTEQPGQHMQCNVLQVIDQGWDMMIAHPPCTYLSNSGAKHLYIDGWKDNGIDKERWLGMEEGAEFFRELLYARIPKVCIENPIMHGHAKAIVGADFSQMIQPWWFGDAETKATCLWLRGLDYLEPTKVIKGRVHDRVHRLAPSPDRWKERSRTYKGIADAMAAQWG